MNKNVKIAKQLIKIAKSLIAGDEDFMKNVFPQALEALGFINYKNGDFHKGLPVNDEKYEYHQINLHILSGNENSIRCNLSYFYDHERIKVNKIDNKTTISFEPDIDSFIDAFKKGLDKLQCPSKYFDFNKAKSVTMNFLENAGY